MNAPFITLLAQAAGEVGSEKQIEVEIDQAKEQVGGLLSRAIEGDMDAIFELSSMYLLPAIIFLLVLIVAYFLGKFLGSAARRPVEKKVDATLGAFVGKLVFYGVMIGALLGVLQYVGIGVASFAAVIAAAGFAVGLAFQGTLSNFAAGIMLLVFRPFKVGDVVSAADITAKVYEIDLFFTLFDTFDNRRFIVPNADIFNQKIENITHHSDRRADVEVGVSYGADIDKTREVLNAAAESLEHLIQGEGRGYQVFLKGLGASSVDWVVRCWVPTAEFWPQKEALVRAIKMKLDEADISIPFPQMDVHLDRVDKDD